MVTQLQFDQFKKEQSQVNQSEKASFSQTSNSIQWTEWNTLV